VLENRGFASVFFDENAENGENDCKMIANQEFSNALQSSIMNKNCVTTIQNLFPLGPNNNTSKVSISVSMSEPQQKNILFFKVGFRIDLCVLSAFSENDWYQLLGISPHFTHGSADGRRLHQESLGCPASMGQAPKLQPRTKLRFPLHKVPPFAEACSTLGNQRILLVYSTSIAH